MADRYDDPSTKLPGRITPPRGTRVSRVSTIPGVRLGDPIAARASDGPIRASDEDVEIVPTVPTVTAKAIESVHPMVQAIDRVGDIIGVLVIAYLILHHAIDGYFGVVCILTLLGVNTGLRQWGTRFLQSRGAQGAGLGMLGLLVGATHGPTASLIVQGMSTLGRGA